MRIRRWWDCGRRLRGWPRHRRDCGRAFLGAWASIAVEWTRGDGVRHDLEQIPVHPVAAASHPSPPQIPPRWRKTMSSVTSLQHEQPYSNTYIATKRFMRCKKLGSNGCYKHTFICCKKNQLAMFTMCCKCHT